MYIVYMYISIVKWSSYIHIVTVSYIFCNDSHDNYKLVMIYIVEIVLS